MTKTSNPVGRPPAIRDAVSSAILGGKMYSTFFVVPPPNVLAKILDLPASSVRSAYRALVKRGELRQTWGIYHLP